jgi:hypothetical protein
MSNEINQFEARAYKRLYGIYKSTLLSIINKARTTVQFASDKPERLLEMLTFIGDEHTWGEVGIESKTDAVIIDELEKCLQEVTNG